MRISLLFALIRQWNQKTRREDKRMGMLIATIHQALGDQHATWLTFFPQWNEGKSKKKQTLNADEQRAKFKNNAKLIGAYGGNQNR